MRSRRLAAVAAVLVAAVAAILLLPRDTDTWLGLVAATGAWAPLLFVAAWIPATCLLFPGPVLYVLAVALFGPAGIALCLVGSPLGALAAFAIARGLAPASLADRLPDRARAVAGRLERSGPWGIALVRSTPGLPACAFNYACGLARVRPRAFVVGIAVGAAPRIVLYGVLGGAALNGNPIVAAVGAAGIVVSLGIALGRRRLRLA
jgi:uncharacterized membrane protein YdjX (TVP38/TMEM64 family)